MPSTKRSFKAKAAILAAAVLSGAGTTMAQLAINEPPDGQILFGAWLDTTYDTPLAFNQRFGHLASSFQFAQDIPLKAYDPVTGAGGPINQTLVELTGSSASIYLTVYPTSNTISDQDLAALGAQIKTYMDAPYNRQVFLRWGPEMNGNWMVYGIQPTAYVQMWQTMYTAIKRIVPNCAIVWAPNGANGYPYGMGLTTIASTGDRNALDTNHDGVLDFNDDAYSPYWPGSQYVDWVGVSYYFKGVYPFTTNVAQPAGFVPGVMTGSDPETPQSAFTPFYQTYCVTANKPCMFSEAGAAYHVNTTSGPGVGQLAIQRAWWSDGWTNASFFNQYPKMKMINMFEHEKVEDAGDLRDFRLTNDTTVMAGFLGDLNANMANKYLWATQQAVPTQLPTGNGGGSPGAGGGRVNGGLPTSNAFTATAGGGGVGGMPSQTKMPSLFSDGARSFIVEKGAVAVAVGVSGLAAVVGAFGVLRR